MTKQVRQFETGATRDTDAGKPDYEGFLSPLVVERFGEYMNGHRVQSDGGQRASDNWQRGIPQPEYLRSAWRHLVDWWKLHRGYPTVDRKTGRSVILEEALCALLFNVQGYLHEVLKAKLTESSGVPVSFAPSPVVARHPEPYWGWSQSVCEVRRTPRGDV